MIKNYLKLSFRNLLRNKTYSFINVFGLSVGIASCILIILYVQNEFSYDKFNKNYKNIYRVCANLNWFGTKGKTPVSSANLGPALKENFREVENYARIYDLSTVKQLIRGNKKSFFEYGLIYSDSSFFSIFSYNLIGGNRYRALTDPFSVVITKSIAEKYFGIHDPLGKVIQIVRSNGKTFDFKVTGIMSDPPANSSLQFKFIASFKSLYTKEWNYSDIGKWDQLSFYTYILLSGKSTAQSLEAKLPAFLKRQPGSEDAVKTMGVSLFLQPLEDIHLFSNFGFQDPSATDVDSLYILSAIAAFLLLIASINFVNLSTARYTKRTKEIGVRKVMGAVRMQLIRQFMSESILMSSIATAFAVILVEFTIPFTKDFMGKELGFYLINAELTPLILLSGAVLIGVIAGLYPALIFASFKTDSILRNTFQSAGTGGIIKKGMVALQFTISIALIISTILVQLQMKYIHEADLGFNKNNVVVIPLINKETADHAGLYCTEVRQNPDIMMASAASSIPGEINMASVFKTSGNKSEELWMNKIYCDPDYLKTLDLKVQEGTVPEFSENGHEVIINEAAQSKLGLKNAVGRELITGYGGKLKIAAVIKDYNFQSLHDKISPLVLQMIPTGSGYILCRIRPSKYSSTVNFLKNKWAEVNRDVPFEYTFLDDNLNKLYVKESRFGGVVNIFSGLAILIACLGLLGLSSFSIEQRTKEIGIRKVLGATIPGIINLVTKEFVVIVLISNIAAWPAAYFFINKWLRNFAFKVEINLWVFVLAGALALLIALATVSFHAIKAATSNPIEAIRYE